MRANPPISLVVIVVIGCCPWLRLELRPIGGVSPGPNAHGLAVAGIVLAQPIDHEVLPGILRIFEALLEGLGLLAFGVFDRALLLFV